MAGFKGSSYINILTYIVFTIVPVIMFATIMSKIFLCIDILKVFCCHLLFRTRILIRVFLLTIIDFWFVEISYSKNSSHNKSRILIRNLLIFWSDKNRWPPIFPRMSTEFLKKMMVICFSWHKMSKKST